MADVAKSAAAAPDQSTRSCSQEWRMLCGRLLSCMNPHAQLPCCLSCCCVAVCVLGRLWVGCCMVLTMQALPGTEHCRILVEGRRACGCGRSSSSIVECCLEPMSVGGCHWKSLTRACTARCPCTAAAGFHLPPARAVANSSACLSAGSVMHPATFVRCPDLDHCGDLHTSLCMQCGCPACMCCTPFFPCITSRCLSRCPTLCSARHM